MQWQSQASRPLVWHLSNIQIPLVHLSSHHSACVSRSAACALPCCTPPDEKPNKSPDLSDVLVRLLLLSPFLPLSPISPFALALCQTKRSYVTRSRSFHVLGHIFTQHALGDYIAGPPAVREFGIGLQAYKGQHGKVCVCVSSENRQGCT